MIVVEQPQHLKIFQVQDVRHVLNFVRLIMLEKICFI